MESTAFNRDAFYQAAWSTLHSSRCMDSTAYNWDPLRHNAWNPLNSIRMLWAMLHKIHCIQSGCIGPRCKDFTAFNLYPLPHNAWNPLHSTTLHGIHCIQSCCLKSTAFNRVPFLHAAYLMKKKMFLCQSFPSSSRPPQ